MSGKMTWLKKEIRLTLPAIIYFMLAFNFIHFTMNLVRSPFDHHYTSYLSMSIDALIMGKVIIISNSLPFINAFPRKPLIYNISWKFMIYAVFVFLLWSIDSMLHLMKHYNIFNIAWNQFLHSLTTPIFMASILWVWVLLAVYVTCDEILTAVGKKKIMQLLFGN